MIICSHFKPQVAEIQMYCEPSHAANELRLQGENAAILEGDIHWACINRIQYCRDAFWIGKQLSLVSEVTIIAS